MSNQILKMSWLLAELAMWEARKYLFEQNYNVFVVTEM